MISLFDNLTENNVLLFGKACLDVTFVHLICFTFVVLVPIIIRWTSSFLSLHLSLSLFLSPRFKFDQDLNLRPNLFRPGIDFMRLTWSDKRWIMCIWWIMWQVHVCFLSNDILFVIRLFFSFCYSKCRKFLWAQIDLAWQLFKNKQINLLTAKILQSESSEKFPL